MRGRYQEAFNDENPGPLCLSSYFSDFCQAASEEAAKGAAEGGGGVEEAEAEGHFAAGVHA